MASLGLAQLRVTCWSPATAVRPVGASGRGKSGVAVAALDDWLQPAVLRAWSRKVYVVPLVSSVTVWAVVDEPEPAMIVKPPYVEPPSVLVR